MPGNPNNIMIGAAQVILGGVDVGYTKGGVTVRYEQEFIEVMADQAAGIVRKARSNERAFITTTLLETGLEQIRRAFMQPSQNLVGSVLTVGYANTCWIDELELILIGPGPECGTRTFTFGRCVAFGNREYSMQREEEVAFEIEFEAMKDSNGVLFRIEDS